MSQIIVNPEEIRMFVNELQQFKHELEHNQQMITSKLDYLGESWQDQEQQIFKEEFSHMIRSMEPMMQKLDEYTAFLDRKAQAADAYLNQR